MARSNDVLKNLISGNLLRPCTKCGDILNPCRCQLELDLERTVYKLTILANMVIELDTKEFDSFDEGCDLLFMRDGDFNLLFDYAHRDVLGIE